MADTPLAHSPTIAAPSSPSGPASEEVRGVAHRLAAGTTVGEYVIDDALGAGAMGEVYAGHHPVIGKKVAIKVLRKELASSEEAAERFTREARAVNQVDHPNVIDVFAYGRLDDGRLYLVMDLVAGESLRARLADGALEVGDALEILDQIAEALDAAHARGVVHRDLKPDNIMISPPHRVFVLDFGIARLVTGEATQGIGTLTGQGTWLGTPAYMAPEQWSTDGAGPASDRYALGVIAFELLSGALPFAASSVPGMMEQHFRAKVPALSMRGSTSPALDDVMQRALAKDPDARFATAHELVTALRAAAGTAAGAAVEPARAPRRILYGTLGVATLGVCLAGAAIVHSHEEQPHAPAVAPEPVEAGTIAIEVTSTPDGAIVQLAGKPQGPTPRTLHLAANAHVDLVVAKPGYLPSHRTFEAGTADTELAVNLGAVTRFEGVWKLPTGELRALERNGDRVAISKLKSVTGHRELYKFYPFVASDTGIAFAADDEVIDPRAPDDKSCHVAVHVEYRYDAARDVLELRRPKVTIDFVGGQCVPRSEDVTPQLLVRVDGAHDSVSIDAPAGTPKPAPPVKSSKPPVKAAKKVPTFPTPPSPKTQKAAQNTKAVVPFDQGSKANAISSANAASSGAKDSGKQVYNNPPDNAQAQQIMQPPQATPQTVVVPQQGKSTKQLDLGEDDLTPQQQAPTKRKK
jgi:tRNA A-37 threonylcarbamoyl transferase component Bud32